MQQICTEANTAQVHRSTNNA